MPVSLPHRSFSDRSLMRFVRAVSSRLGLRDDILTLSSASPRRLVAVSPSPSQISAPLFSIICALFRLSDYPTRIVVLSERSEAKDHSSVFSAAYALFRFLYCANSLFFNGLRTLLQNRGGVPQLFPNWNRRARARPYKNKSDREATNDSRRSEKIRTLEPAGRHPPATSSRNEGKAAIKPPFAEAQGNPHSEMPCHQIRQASW